VTLGCIQPGVTVRGYSIVDPHSTTVHRGEDASSKVPVSSITFPLASVVKYRPLMYVALRVVLLQVVTPSVNENDTTVGAKLWAAVMSAVVVPSGSGAVRVIDPLTLSEVVDP